MEFLAELWLPILLSAVFVFLASSILHMMIPIHRTDYGQMPGEDAVMEAMRAQGVGRGTYMFPHCKDFKDMGSEEQMAKFKAGPVGWMTVLEPGPPTMGKSLIQWFVFCLVMGVFVGYLGSHALLDGAEYMAVFRMTGTIAFLGYGVGAATDSIWKGQRWGVTIKFFVDGLIYALVTAGTFAWLWPELI
jgi:hypothetical protein